MEVAARVRSFITSNFYVADSAKLTDEDSLLDGGVVDSTGILEVVSHIEAQFGIRVLDEEMLPENLDSIGKITRFVERKQKD
jgi:acyl carrier protein